jgi:hypothetical protein
MTADSSHIENPRMDINVKRPVRAPEIPISPLPMTEEQDRAEDQNLPIDPEAIQREDEVEEASDDSFPASDPPSYTRSTTTTD